MSTTARQIQSLTWSFGSIWCSTNLAARSLINRYALSVSSFASPIHVTNRVGAGIDLPHERNLLLLRPGSPDQYR